MKIVLLFGLLATAFAIDSSGPFSYSTKEIRVVFDFLDRNMDGIIHQSELFTKFRKDDTNDDKKVSYEEFTAGFPPEIPSSLINGTFIFFDGMDDNVDGVLDPSIVCRLFAFLDANNNRKGVFGEFKTVVDQVLSSIS
ncbi:uncharacterized protein LOC112568858 isoform X1 [Pomacea canaliculata]|uniref:uncharacterized protein LOC112568858 isoform X1 n=1 Tax=Pomacea canaliculata TaxID=400727 RepID=UPI000D72AC9B|nr:uncharacterized protein LOC112568858 isoform X1 [Pomacea canaliculata]